MTAVRQAVILVGGRGTRLGSLTNNLPKPMMSVGGIPFLEYQLEYLRPFGITRILFCSGYLASHIQDYFGTGERVNFDIQYSIEDHPAGTGGALAGARHLLDPIFYALNGDTLFEADLLKLNEVLTSGSNGRLGALALREVEDVERYGNIRLEGDQIINFAEKKGTGRGFINAGVYCLRREALELLPEAPCSLEKELFPNLARTGRLGGLRGNGYFIDIGLPETLARAQVELPALFASGSELNRPAASRPLQ